MFPTSVILKLAELGNTRVRLGRGTHGASEARQQRRDETHRGRHGACAVRHDFMQRTAGEAAVRQMGIDRRHAEGEGFARALRRSGQQAA
jgi:hypothetical protein